MEIREFSRHDIPDALALCAQVNWNHIAADWERVLALNPQGCLGGFIDGKLKATCTFLAFGSLGWLGTFLVDQALRGHGLGTRLCEAALRRADGLGLETLALDSSDVGRPIYLKQGFQATDMGIALWTGPNPGRTADGTLPLQEPHWAALMELDRASTGVDREAQLRGLWHEPGAAARVVLTGQGLAGFGFSRPGRLTGTIGPVVARDFATARPLFAALMADRKELDQGQPIGMALPDQPAVAQWIGAQGLQMRRRNLRMFRPRVTDKLSGTRIFAVTGLGMG